MMDLTRLGLIAGLLVAIAAIAGGFWGFLLALVLGTVGALLGAQLDGRIDLGRLLSGRSRG